MDIFDSLVGIFQNLIVSAAFLMFLVAIFYYVSSGGDSGKVKKAKDFLLSAVTALVALVLVKMFLGGNNDTISPPTITQIANPINGIMNAIKCPTTGCSTDALAIFDVASAILTGITNLILEIIPVFAVLMTMYAGIQYIFSAGDPKKSEGAVKMLNSSIIGFAIFLMLYALWAFIGQFIGLFSTT